jgi:hypothetical protein
MLHAPLDVLRRYVLEGKLNGAERIGIGLYAYGAKGAIVEKGYVAFDADGVDADGRFRLLNAADGQGPGTLTLREGCRVLLIRIIQRDPTREPALLRLDGATPMPGLALATGSAEGALEMTARSLVKAVNDYLRWTAAVQSAPNRLIPPPAELAEAVNAEPQTQYFVGCFDLAEGHWLEVRMPSDLPDYWSLHAYNHWFEHLQTQGVHDANAVRDVDGQLLIRVGPSAPGQLPNRIDTLGRRRGALIYRIIGAPTLSAPPEARVRG